MDNTWWRSSKEVDPDQIKLYSLDIDGDYLILGPPGSGKTNVLLLRAVYLAKAGKANTRVITFGRTLAEFVSSGADANGNYPGDRISTFAWWAIRMYKDLTGKYLDTKGKDHDSARQERIDVLKEVLAKRKPGKSYYDSILVDEVQDFWSEELDILSGLTSRLFVAGDNRQRIYGRNEGIEKSRALGCEEHRLVNHYRIGRAICRVADNICPTADEDSLLAHMQYDESKLPSHAKLHSCPSLENQFENMEDRLKNQLRAYPGQLLGVIVPRNSLLSWLGNRFDKSELSDKVQIHTDDDRSFESDKPICVMGAHSSKGTEFRGVHLFSAESFGVHYTRELGFTVVTRAKTAFDAYKTGPIDGSLEGALSEERVPHVEEVF